MTTNAWQALRESREERTGAGSYDFPPFPKWAEGKSRIVILSDGVDKTADQVYNEVGIELPEGVETLYSFDMFRSYQLKQKFFNDEEKERFRFPKKIAYRPGDTIDPRYEIQHEEDHYEKQEQRLRTYVKENGTEDGFREWSYRGINLGYMNSSCFLYIFNITAFEAIWKANAGEQLSREQQWYYDQMAKDTKYFDEDGNFVALFKYDAHHDMKIAMDNYAKDQQAENVKVPSLLKYVWQAKKKGDYAAGERVSYDFEHDETRPTADLPDYIKEAITAAMDNYPMKPLSEAVEQMRYDPGDTPDEDTGVAPNHSVKALADAEAANAKAEKREPVTAGVGSSSTNDETLDEGW